MDVSLKKVILAAVTAEEGRISGIPVFYAQSEEQRAVMATILSRVLEAVAHDMGNGVYILVKH